MVPLYVLGTKIYHFVAKFFQIGQILNLESINSESDNGPHLSAVTWQKRMIFLLRWARSHMSGDLKNPLKQVNAFFPRGHRRPSSRQATVGHLPGRRRPKPVAPARIRPPPAPSGHSRSPPPASYRASRRARQLPAGPPDAPSSSQPPGCAGPWQISATLAPAGGRPCCPAGARSCSEVARAGPDGARPALGWVAGGREGLVGGGGGVARGGEGGGGEDGRRRRGWPAVSPVRS
jgi:hypothetical protein